MPQPEVPDFVNDHLEEMRWNLSGKVRAKTAIDVEGLVASGDLIPTRRS
jgi:hypothetical protein